ncbi:hypothetical protein FNV43_RR00503 [Rhamnella rubrinervis]|uniref:Uncharacterized protein n=1 Tax=Rhamnella rubrinervis TaxID=2594499 RepID=A0A8K0HNQ9_9ROSA|nr:hypothetical protein FNV43_RR00503 [Rhamnella rubrinervis]
MEGCRDQRQQYENIGPNNLMKKLLTQLFNDEVAIISLDTPFVGLPFIQDIPHHKRVLIVSDDVDTFGLNDIESLEFYSGMLLEEILIQRRPYQRGWQVLRTSDEVLDGAAIKNIFFDIACFFETPFTREYAESILDDGNSSTKIGISILIDKSLLKISHEENYFRMHDLIRQMGWSVVSYEHKEPGSRSSNKFKLKPSLFSNELRYCQWDFYPLESLPLDFTPENLVKFILRHSHLKQLENHVIKLKKKDLSDSKLLTRIADLSQVSNLESIILEGCTSLFHALSSLQNLHKFTHLNLSGCNKLRDLAQISWRRGHLDIVSCGESLKLIEEVPPNLMLFNAAECTSLETILSQTNKSYLMVEKSLHLENCLKFNQNTQNFVGNSAIFSMFHAMLHEHMSPPKQVYPSNDLCICYPGDEIPNEFTYQSRRSSTNINLPLSWKRDLLGVANTYVFMNYAINDDACRESGLSRRSVLITCFCN